MKKEREGKPNTLGMVFSCRDAEFTQIKNSLSDLHFDSVAAFLCTGLSYFR